MFLTVRKNIKSTFSRIKKKPLGNKMKMCVYVCLCVKSERGDKIILQNAGILQIIGTWEFIHIFSPLLVSLIKDYHWIYSCSN